MEGRIIALAAVLAVLGFSGSSRAQPAAFMHQVESLDAVEPIVPESIDLEVLLAEDQQREEFGSPYRFGVARSVHATPQTDGVWEQLDAETLLWRLPIASPGAVCLSLGFTRFFMPPHGSLYIYTSDESQVRGPFTNKDNADHGELWTPLLNSDAIVVELTIPVSEVPQLELELTSINHGYRGFQTEWTLGLGDSLGCNVDVACKEGDPWRDQIRSVAWYTLVSEGYQVWCSGSLVNNTAEDDTPYFLTAFHCFDPVRDLTIAAPYEAARTMVVYWNYESSTCGGTWASDGQNQSGATFRAAYWASDVALVELGSKPPASYNVFYAGWDRRSTAPSSAAAIHHPHSDSKKISIENDPLSLIRLIIAGVDHGIHFVVNQWDRGLIEQGSSGCPLFNSDKRIAGQLRSTPEIPTCANPQPARFGPLYRSWDEGTTPDTRLSDWLDRGNTGLTFLDGKNPGGTTVLTFEGITTDEIARIPDGYGGLSWSPSFCVYRPPAAGANNGYVNGRISPDYVAYNGSGVPVDVRGSPFDFIGTYLTAAGQDSLSILIEGYRSGVPVYSQTVIVNRQSPTWIWLGYEAVDRVTFTPTPYTGIGYQFVMDDMVIKRSATPGSAIEYASSDVPTEIWDNMSVFSTLVIADTGTIADIDVKLDITHTYCEDLSVYLRPPSSFGLSRIRLFSSVGNAQNNFSNTILDDEASVPITRGTAPFTGSFRPVGRLSALYGGSMTGTWKLEVSDEARYDQGMLNSWSLIIKK